MFKIDTPFPDFTLDAYLPKKKDEGKVSLKDFKGKWLILFWYPADFTFVCPTELADIATRYKEFQEYDAEILGASTDTIYTHKAWLETEKLLKEVSYPIAADHAGHFARMLTIYDETSGMAQRAAFIIDPDGILRAVDIVSDPIGRSAGELLRKLKALYFVRKNPGRVCPASWDEGQATIKKSLAIAGDVGKGMSKR
ncbi:MAG: peroxiredoxin [Parcubacteria group bacterium]|nr:peroxiredoxin [Parcubacteria group bacterium]